MVDLEVISIVGPIVNVKMKYALLLILHRGLVAKTEVNICLGEILTQRLLVHSLENLDGLYALTLFTIFLRRCDFVSF